MLSPGQCTVLNIEQSREGVEEDAFKNVTVVELAN